MTASLAGVWAKIERGHEHREMLGAYMREFLAVESEKPRVGVKFDAQTGEHVLYVNYAPDPTIFKQRAALLIGDAIQNFRSALDYLVHQLAILHTKDHIVHPHFTQFPIADSEVEFRRTAFAGRRPRLGEIHPDHAALIERLQPYHRVHECKIDRIAFNPLAVLRDMSDADKHRLLTPVFLYTLSMGVSDPLLAHVLWTQNPDAWTWLETVRLTPIELGAEIARAKLDDRLREYKVDVAGVLTPRVMFPERWTVEKVLDKFETLVKEVVGEFVSVFP